MQAQSTIHRSAGLRPDILVFLSACLLIALIPARALPAQAASSQKIDIGKWLRLETETLIELHSRKGDQTAAGQRARRQGGRRGNL